jgi:AcrR family transcriptional regulator
MVPPVLPRAFVEAHNRRRIVRPVAELAHDQGIERVTTAKICQRAKMSRVAFYALFETSAGGLRYAFEEAFAEVFKPAEAAAAGIEPWLKRVETGLGAFYAGIVAEPLLAELCLVHSAGTTGEAPAHYYEAVVELAIRLIAGGRVAGLAANRKSYRDPGPLIEEYLARSIVSLAALRLRQGGAKQLPGQREEMTLLVANAFLGSEGGVPSLAGASA